MALPRSPIADATSFWRHLIYIHLRPLTVQYITSSSHLLPLPEGIKDKPKNSHTLINNFNLVYHIYIYIYLQKEFYLILKTFQKLLIIIIFGFAILVD